jgi:hypothetical protein
MRRTRRKAKTFNTEGTESTEKKTGFKTGIQVFKTERQALRWGTNPITTPAFLFESFATSR